MEELIEKYALKNAVEHDGKAFSKAIFSKLVVEDPSAKQNVELTMQLIDKVIERVNRMDISEQKIRLLKIDPHILDKKEVVKKELKLPNVSGKVVMRYAPNPNAGMHIGNARVAILNDYFVRKYGGKFILRFDDTDAKNETKKPSKNAYQQIRNDLNWLGVDVHEESAASQRLGRYYNIFEDLLRRNKAYICTCDAEEWRERRKAGIACSCRMTSIYENKRKWSLMLNHELKEGSAVSRIKTDMHYKDPAQRDWVAFRIVDKPDHAIAKNKYHVWPMLDFASAIDDYDFKVTHILRGQDLKISELRQKWVYSYLNWTYPTTITLGHLGFRGMGTFSKSEMKEGINKGKYSGWDDPQLPMIASYKRRGFHPESIRTLIIEEGLTGGKISLSEDILVAHNKDLIDGVTKRYFFVESPVRVKIKGVEKKEVEIPNHPTNTKLGSRRISLANTLYLAKKDFDNMKKSKKTRLVDLGNFIKQNNTTIEIKGSQEMTHDLQKIQWVNHQGKKCTILMPDGSKIEGIAEESVKEESIGTVVQFLRFAFVSMDSKTPLTFVYAHK